MHTASENAKISYAIPVAATYRTAGSATGVGVDMAKYNNYAAIINVAGATQWQGALTCSIAESTDNTTFSTAYLATLTIATATTHTAQSLEVRAEQMTDDYRYLRVEVAPASGTGNLYSAVNVQFNPRYLAP
jgi:hypothetical protein